MVHKRGAPVLAIAVPCFNEEEVLEEAASQLLSLLDRLLESQKVAPASYVCFIDDGSFDKTWFLVEELAKSDSRIHGIKLSRNCGHQYALLAGLLTLQADAVVSIDADLQDDVEVIEEMVDAHADGYDIVYGVRSDRRSDNFLKRFTAEAYYRLLRLMGVSVVFNHADFRLMSRRSLDALKQYEEVNLFLRGIIPTIGFPSTTVQYVRRRRFAGESKYALRNMLELAFNGATSFSPVPLRFIALVGVGFSLVSVLLSIWALWTKFIAANAIPGWASTVLPVYFLGGIQLLSIGAVGEYVSKIYLEAKRRPRYIIEQIVGSSSGASHR